MSKFRKLLSKMVNIEIWPYLEKRGYRQYPSKRPFTGITFALEGKESVGLITIFSSRHSSGSNLGWDYLIDLGVSFFGIRGMLGMDVLPEVPQAAAECLYNVRVENVVMDVKNGQWVLTKEKLPESTINFLQHHMVLFEADAMDKRSKELLPIIRDSAVPWIEKHVSADTFVDMKMDIPSLLVLFNMTVGGLIGPALLIKQGKRSEAEDYLKACYSHVMDLFKNHDRVDDAMYYEFADRLASAFGAFAVRNNLTFEGVAAAKVAKDKIRHKK
jgi:hypothetical protein